ncbi:MAG: 4-(cytidine 5'-diphospho)-2-C-methyl-D-erythritol kinase [Alphaproteobacteria bacterium]
MTPSSTALIEPAPAKINLFLHITGRRADGYHLLHSMVCFADLGEQIRAEPAERDSLILQDAPADLAAEPVEQNLVWRAMLAFRQRFGEGQRYTIRLTKRIPVGGGLGGGSADAAAMLRILARERGIELDDPELLSLAAELGADIPMCLHQTPQLAAGIGDKLTALPNPLPPLWVLLANPGVHVSTPSVFSALDLGACHKAVSLPQDEWPDAQTFADWLAGSTQNDMTKAACAIAPEVAALLSRLRSTNAPLLTRMSGSGASCFVLFADQASARAAQSELLAQDPYLWSHVAKILS